MELPDNLIFAVIDFAIFIEFSSDELLDPDTGIQALENLSYRLNGLDPSTKEYLTARIKALAPTYGNREQFVGGLAENLGIE